MGTTRRRTATPACYATRKRAPTDEQKRQWDRAHAERQTLIARPFAQTQVHGRTYPWAGVLVPREAELIKDNALGMQTQYNGRYASAEVAAEWDNLVNSYEGGS